MAVQIFYFKAESKIEIEGEQILLRDAGRILCADTRLQHKAELLVLHRWTKMEHRIVMNTMTIIDKLQKEIPDSVVLNLGATDIVIERITKKTHPLWEKIKIVLIAILCFFGAAFTIMAFHNDIGIHDIFVRVYELLTGRQAEGFTILEVAYSLGLSCGIILFFNHIGGRRITKDPTPVEVQMRKYEGDVVTALVENADRNQEEL